MGCEAPNPGGIQIPCMHAERHSSGVPPWERLFNNKLQDHPNLAILFVWYRPHFRPPARNRKKKQEQKKCGLWPPPENRKNSRKMRKMAQTWLNIWIWGPSISGGGHNPHFSYFLFRAGGLKWGLYQANRIAIQTRNILKDEVRKHPLSCKFLGGVALQHN